MAKFTNTAYQEMFTEVEIRASDSQDAVRKFKALIANDAISWHPSDEVTDISISEEVAEVRCVAEVSSEFLDLPVKA